MTAPPAPRRRPERASRVGPVSNGGARSGRQRAGACWAGRGAAGLRGCGRRLQAAAAAPRICAALRCAHPARAPCRPGPAGEGEGGAGVGVLGLAGRGPPSWRLRRPPPPPCPHPRPLGPSHLEHIPLVHHRRRDLGGARHAAVLVKLAQDRALGREGQQRLGPRRGGAGRRGAARGGAGRRGTGPGGARLGAIKVKDSLQVAESGPRAGAAAGTGAYTRREARPGPQLPARAPARAPPFAAHPPPPAPYLDRRGRAPLGAALEVLAQDDDCDEDRAGLKEVLLGWGVGGGGGGGGG
jgi:hypothetical protein